MSNIGKQFPSEMETYTDQKTGRKITQLTKNGDNYHFYFTENSFTQGDEEIIYQHSEIPYSEKGSFVNLFAMDLKTGIRTQLTDFKEQFKFVGAFSFTKTVDSKIFIFVADGDVYRFERENNNIYRIYKTPEGFHITSLNISHDGYYVAATINETPKLDRELKRANYDGFVENFYAIKRGMIVVMKSDGTDSQVVFHATHWLGHIQFAPDSNEYLMFCHEGPWNRVQQRIWLYNLITRTVEPCFRQKEEDSVGHEFWTRDGLIFFDNRGAGHDGSITVDKTQATIIPSDSEDAIPEVGFADRYGKIIKTIKLPYYCNHYHANKDNTLLVADAINDLVLIDISKIDASFEVLCEHNTSWLSHNVHCHPTWSWSNDKILFATDKEKQGYAQLYLINM
ncbi:MAG: hypothetical protein IKB93_06175 [Clostridia bacterium]|nr:hypothetical protein [Clostridia bacterium]